MFLALNVQMEEYQPYNYRYVKCCAIQLKKLFFQFHIKMHLYLLVH